MKPPNAVASDLTEARAIIEHALKSAGPTRQLTIAWCNDGLPSFSLLIHDDIEQLDADGKPIPDTITAVAWAEAATVDEGLIALADKLAVGAVMVP